MSEIVAPIITDSTGQAIATAISGAVSKADKSDIAPEFSTSADYAKGSMVYYQGTLYEFTAAHNHAAWTGSDVIAVKISSEINTLKSGLNDVNSNLYSRKLLFESASTGTYSDKLDSIFAVYNNLTDSQKARTCIEYYATVLTMTTRPSFASLPYYEIDDSAPRSFSATLKTSGSTLYKFVYGASGTTVTDISKQTANNTLKLYLLS